MVALGDIYGDCKAETNADEGGETRAGEPYGDDSMELFKFGDGKWESQTLLLAILTVSIPVLEISSVSPSLSVSMNGNFSKLTV